MPWPLLTNLAELARVRAADRKFPPGPRPDPEGQRIAEAIAPFIRTDREAAMDRLATAAHGVFAQQIGRGESGANNSGPDVAEWIAPARVPQNWCAGVYGWSYEVAAKGLGIALPFRRSLGAKRLGENMAAVGGKIGLRECKPGDAVVLHRGAQGSWLGHIMSFDDLIRERLFVLEGNAGPYPAKVRRHVYDVPSLRLALCASLRQ